MPPRVSPQRKEISRRVGDAGAIVGGHISQEAVCFIAHSVSYDSKRPPGHRTIHKGRIAPKPPGTIPSVAKHFFGKACCKSAAKSDRHNITNPQTLENKGLAGICQPRVIIPTRKMKLNSKRFCLGDLISFDFS